MFYKKNYFSKELLNKFQKDFCFEFSLALFDLEAIKEEKKDYPTPYGLWIIINNNLKVEIKLMF